MNPGMGPMNQGPMGPSGVMNTMNQGGMPGNMMGQRMGMNQNFMG